MHATKDDTPCPSPAEKRRATSSRDHVDGCAYRTNTPSSRHRSPRSRSTASSSSPRTRGSLHDNDRSMVFVTNTPAGSSHRGSDRPDTKVLRLEEEHCGAYATARFARDLRQLMAAPHLRPSATHPFIQQCQRPRRTPRTDPSPPSRRTTSPAPATAQRACPPRRPTPHAAGRQQHDTDQRAHSVHPPTRLTVWPAWSVLERSRWSPWISMTRSPTVPPAPHLRLRSLARLRSLFSSTGTPTISVTPLPRLRLAAGPHDPSPAGIGAPLATTHPPPARARRTHPSLPSNRQSLLYAHPFEWLRGRRDYGWYTISIANHCGRDGQTNRQFTR